MSQTYVIVEPGSTHQRNHNAMRTHIENAKAVPGLPASLGQAHRDRPRHASGLPLWRVHHGRHAAARVRDLFVFLAVFVIGAVATIAARDPTFDYFLRGPRD